jgi:hypothetical protein
MGRKKKSRGGRPRFPRGTTKAAIHKKIMRERRKVKLKIRAERKQQLQDEKDERLYVRWLLFCKGRGKDKNLKEKDSQFINRHVHKTYDKYLMALQLGIDTRAARYYHTIKRDPNHPPSFQTYRRIWYGGAKFVYVHKDIPRLMKMRWEEFQSASRNTEVPQQPAGKWMLELQREINEREPGDLGVSVSELPGGVRSNKRWHPGQKPFRERREEETGSDRDAATVGT